MIEVQGIKIIDKISSTETRERIFCQMALTQAHICTSEAFPLLAVAGRKHFCKLLWCTKLSLRQCKSTAAVRALLYLLFAITHLQRRQK